MTKLAVAAAAHADAPARPEAAAAATAPAAEAKPAAKAADERPATKASAKAEAKPPAPGDSDLERLRHGWPQVISMIGANPSLRPLILDCRPIGVEANVVTLGFPEEKAFFKDVAERRRANLESGLGQFLGHDVGVRCVATNFELVPPLPSDVDEARILDEANRIFADDLADVPEIT